MLVKRLLLEEVWSPPTASFGIPHRYGEFDDDHSSIDYRMDASRPFLYRALRG